MEILTSTTTRYGKQGASGARVVTFSTTQTVIGGDGKEFSQTMSRSMVLLPSGAFLPESFSSEPEADIALDEYEDELKRRRRNQPG